MGPSLCALIVLSHDWSVAVAIPQVSDIWSPGLIGPRRGWHWAGIMAPADLIKPTRGWSIGSFCCAKLIWPSTNQHEKRGKNETTMSCVDIGAVKDYIHWRIPRNSGGGGGGGLPFLGYTSLETPALSSDETQRLLAGLQAVLQVPASVPAKSPCAFTIRNGNHDKGTHPWCDWIQILLARHDIQNCCQYVLTSHEYYMNCWLCERYLMV